VVNRSGTVSRHLPTVARRRSGVGRSHPVVRASPDTAPPPDRVRDATGHLRLRSPRVIVVRLERT
jgi:hypothetical protein